MVIPRAAIARALEAEERVDDTRVSPNANPAEIMFCPRL